MEANLELQVAQSAIKAGLLSEKELVQAVELQQVCGRNRVDLPLAQVILQKYASLPQARHQYLSCLIHELEIPELRQYLDPYGMELFPTWKTELAKGQDNLQDTKLQEKAQTIHQEMKKIGLELPLPHLALLLQGPSPVSWPKNPHVSGFGSRKLDLTKFCERTRGAELLPLYSRVSKLSGGLVRMEEIEQIIMAQKELEKKHGFKIPIIHLLIEKYQLEPYLLHAILLSQLIWEEDGSCGIWWGGLLIISLKLTTEASLVAKQVQQVCQEFLERCFQLAWLEFSPEKEFHLVEHFEKKLAPPLLEENRKIQQEMDKAGFSLSFLKVAVLRHDILGADLLEGVLTLLYKMTPDNIARIVSPLREAEKKQLDQVKAQVQARTERTAKLDTKVKLKKDLAQTMAVTPAHMAKKGKDAPAAAARIMERLQKTKETPVAQAETTATASPAADTKKIPGPAVADKAAPAAPTAPVVAEETQKMPQRPKITVTLTEEMIRVREAVAKKMVHEEDVLKALIIQSEQGKDKSANLMDILQNNQILSKDHYSELMIIPVSDHKVEMEQSTSDLDLLLAHLIMDYNILPREQIQKMLRLQNSLHCLNIRYSLEKLLIVTKALAPDMVSPLVAECTRRKEGKPKGGGLGSTMRVEQKAMAPAPSVSPTTKPAGVKLSLLVPLAMLALVVIVWQVSELFINKPAPRPVTLTENNPNPNATPTTTPEVVPPEKNSTTPKTTPTTVVETPWTAKPDETVTTEPVSSYVPTQEPPRLVYQQPELRRSEILYKETFLEWIGEFVLPGLAEGKIFQAQFQLWDLGKENQYADKTFTLNQDKVVWQLALARPMLPGFYYLKLEIPIAKQEAATQKVLPKDVEWWLPLTIGTAGEIKKVAIQNLKDMENLVTEAHRQWEDLQKMSKEPWQQVKNKWNSFEAKWQKKQGQLIEKTNRLSESVLVPFHAGATTSLRSLLDKQGILFGDLESWAKGLSLVPPDLATEEANLLGVEAKCQILLTERKQAIQRLLAQSENK